MKFAMCNEFCVGWAIEDAFRLARDTGYNGVEIVRLIVCFRQVALLSGRPVAKDSLRTCRKCAFRQSSGKQGRSMIR